MTLNFLLFLLLEFVALFFTIQSHSYHKSKFINSANSITGGFYKRGNTINEFFHLKSENLRLSEENARLKNTLLKENYTIEKAQVEKVAVDWFKAYLTQSEYDEE